ncbi:dipeptide ABC transporter ATP-binding protein [Sphingomonas sp. SFZ2018-12]|uniref:ABC transporter ATP-binding protein n=1 Tax=Sphingomonas sp. SFZ2018-12 TaxID=2683197 RepID=UPI001F0DD418|nr:dipeptide ABC transporter ATP-binding protein [Sphingomonas sp. SFZ2018-12]
MPSIPIDPPPLLSARDIGVTFRVEGGEVAAVRGVDLDIRRGEMLALVGESGSGKSVTARVLMGLLGRNARISPDTRIMLEGQPLDIADDRRMRRERGRSIAMVFQEPMSSLNPVYRVGDQIVEAIRAHQPLRKAAALARAAELLAQVQLPDPSAMLRRYPHELSGGQRQRVMIAMALANHPRLLIADEPTTALDVRVQAEILELIRALQVEHDIAVLLITHDLTVVRNYADRVAVMQRGALVEQGHTATLFANPQHPYTRQLLAAEPTGFADPVAPGAPLIEAAAVRIAFPGRGKSAPTIAVHGADLQVARGEAVGIVGESGSGKTTLALALTRLIEASGGEIRFAGEAIHRHDRRRMRPLRTRMQIVLQDPFASLNPRMSVRALVEEGLIVNRIGNGAADRLDRVKAALVAAGLPTDILNRFPHEFSGGQRQRLSIARAIAVEPELLVLDEPTSALDLSVQAQILDTLRTLQRERGLSYLFISHDLRVVRALCQRVIVMRDGRIVEEGTARDVLERPSTDYTARLVQAAFHIR